MKAALAVCACSVLLASSFIAGQSRPSEGLTDNPVFKKNCEKCHGKTAAGRHFGGPSLLSEKATAASPDDLRNMITNGRGRMPKYGAKLPAAEIDKLVQQIKSAATK
jgi:cytochrome c5